MLFSWHNEYLLLVLYNIFRGISHFVLNYLYASTKVLCSVGRIEGAVKFGRDWTIPVDATKSEDKRVKSGEYRDWRKRTKINS